MRLQNGTLWCDVQTTLKRYFAGNAIYHGKDLTKIVERTISLIAGDGAETGNAHGMHDGMAAGGGQGGPKQ
jgi:hypothetical protein